jgi:hypothetical protein
MLSGCTLPTIYHINERPIAPPQLRRTVNIALSWPSPADVDALQGAFLIRDGPAVDDAELAIARAILRTNARLQPAYALLFAGATVRAARSHSPQALSAAGAIGIAQFMPETAAEVGLNPYDPFESIEGAAALIAGYADAYRGRYADPYSAALAAYNAGPFAVARYRGVPPYAETREYIALIYDRWARIVSYERTGGD